MITQRLVDSVKAHEGFRDKAYKDSVGVWTIGYGTNLEATTVTRQVAEDWMRADLESITRQLLTIPTFMKMDLVRQDVIIEMAYNLGYNGILAFKNMWSHLRAGDWAEAATDMLDSKWAKQVGRRAITLADRMRSGEWEKKSAEITQPEPPKKAKSSLLGWVR